MNRKALIAITALSAAVFAAPAMAQMRSPSLSSAYVGGSLGQSKFKVDCGGCDTKDTAFRLFGGYQFNRTIAVELGYTDLGKLGDSGASVEANAWDLSGVFSWPFANQFAAFGRLGLARVEGKGGGESDTKNALTWGLGVQYDVMRNLGLRGEFQRYKVDAGAGVGDVNIDVLSIGALWRFQ
jgi:OmpA-OmpF porin, OOP family